MRIAIAADSAPPTPSGVARAVASLAAGLAARRHGVVHVGPRWPDRAQDPADREGRPDLALPAVPIRPSIGLRLAPTTVGGMQRRLQEHDLHVLHVHTEGPVGWAARGAAHRLGIPVVATLHTFYEHYLHYACLPRVFGPAGRRAVRLGLRRFLQGVDHVIAPSPAAADLAARLSPTTPVTLVPNAAPTPMPGPSAAALRAPYPPALLSVGRLAPEKRARQLVAALGEALTRRPELRATVIGGGPDLASLRRQVRRAGLDDRLHLPGALPHRAVLAAYRTAGVYLSTSRSENHPLSLLEAAAAGLPLVVADDPRLLAAGLGGVASTGRDDTDVVATAVALLDDAAQRARASRAALAYAARHTVADHLDRTEAVYRATAAVTAGVPATR